MDKALVALGIVVLTLVSGCTTIPDIPDSEYTFLSVDDFDLNLCSNVNSFCECPRDSGLVECQWTCALVASNGSPVGFKVKAVDYETGSALEDVGGNVRFGNSGGGGSLEYFDCYHALESDDVEVEVFAKGHSPKKIKFKLPPNKLVTLEVPLKKSCSEEDYNHERESFFVGTIERYFGLKEEDYKLKCGEQKLRLMNATGTYSSSIPFELSRYYAVSSGGSGWITVCFSTPDDALFNRVKDYICNEQLLGEYTSQHYGPEDFANCKNGAFDYISANKKTISLNSATSWSLDETLIRKPGGTASKGEEDCLGN